MMVHESAPLPTLPSFEEHSLDAHMDDLEGDLLHELIISQQRDEAHDVLTPLQPVVQNGNDTPLSVSGGYTSEESDYSVATPSTDEQLYKDMSLLQRADTIELVDAVVDFCTEDLMDATIGATEEPEFTMKQAPFAGKLIKGKTSKYRGVTQTSKSSWGAKYSAKRITNTCKTPEEAARAYDQYLKQHYPEKYGKFANFCVQCDQFVNPLGLAEFQNECLCGSTSPETDAEHEMETDSSGNASPVNMTTVYPSEVVATPIQNDNVQAPENRDSVLSVGSLKFSFSDDNEQFFEESFLMMSKMADDQPIQETTEMIVKEEPPQDATLKRKESLPMAVIQSAMESLTKEDGFDTLVDEFGRSSSMSLGPQAVPPMVQPSEASVPPVAPPMFVVNTAPTSESSTFVDFSAEELQDLTDCFLSEQPTEMSGVEAMKPEPSGFVLGSYGFQKTHSLDFENHAAMAQPHYGAPQMTPIDVDAVNATIDQSTTQHGFTTSMYPTVSATPATSSFPAIISIQTPFLEKYWRNDRKNIQCFPYCPEHGDYYRVRIENLQHRCKGVCRAAVKASVTIPAAVAQQYALEHGGFSVLARCNSTFSRNASLSAQALLNANEMKSLQTVSAVGAIDHMSHVPNTHGGADVRFDVTFYPDVWKFEFDLPKKRRHTQGAAAANDGDDGLGAEFLYFFEIDVFYSNDKLSFQRLGHMESSNFQIGNTRTLLRQRNKMTEANLMYHGNMIHEDRVLENDAMPEKKKVKTYLGQLARTSTMDEEDLAVARSGPAYMKEPPHDPALVDQKALVKPATKDQDEVSIESSEYNPYVTPKANDQPLLEADDRLLVGTKADNSSYMVLPHDATRPADATTSIWSTLAPLVVYSIVSVPLCVVYLPIGALLLLAFILMPPSSSVVARVLDTLSDLELRNANSKCGASDTRYELRRVTATSSSSTTSRWFTYHREGAMWARLLYFGGFKLIIATVMGIPTLAFCILAVVCFPIRPLARALCHLSMCCALVSREYTRRTVGKPRTTAPPIVPTAHDAVHALV